MSLLTRLQKLRRSHIDSQKRDVDGGRESGTAGVRERRRERKTRESGREGGREGGRSEMEGGREGEREREREREREQLTAGHTEIDTMAICGLNGSHSYVCTFPKDISSKTCSRSFSGPARALREGQWTFGCTFHLKG
jgi:hypothetical protein